MSEADRYSRQVRFEPIGLDGQRKIAAARVGVVGLGALGGIEVEQLTRAGVGYVRAIDRDLVEVSNLQRQTLFTEEDARSNLPKAVAARRRLEQINSDVVLDFTVDDLNPANVEQWLDGLDLVVDGLDNFETRFVLNDACRKLGIPWVYAAAVGGYGLTMPVLSDGPCLRCVVDTLPAAGSSPTCDTAGVIAPATGTIGSLAVAIALRLLVSGIDPDSVRLTTIDVWTMRPQVVGIPSGLRDRCPLCSEGRMDYLATDPLRTVQLCGRNAVQLIPSVRTDLDLDRLSRSLAVFGPVEWNEFLLKCSNPPYELTLFKDGRAIVKGTEEPSLARSLYSRMVGA